MDTALVKVGGRWRHRKSGGPPMGRVEPVESTGGSVAYSVGPHECNSLVALSVAIS